MYEIARAFIGVFAKVIEGFEVLTERLVALEKRISNLEKLQTEKEER